MTKGDFLLLVREFRQAQRQCQRLKPFAHLVDDIPACKRTLVMATPAALAPENLTRLELVTEAMRAAPEELARRAPHELAGLVTEDRGKRYGRAARLGKNPSKPKTRIKQAGEDQMHPHE